MKILALDMAKRTGWARNDFYGKVKSGVKEFSTPPKGTLPTQFYARFFDWLHAQGKVDYLVIESPINTRQFSGGYGRELAALALLWADNQGVEVLSIFPSTLKKYATGSGRANKMQMIAAAIKKYPDQDVQDDNHADALHLLAWGTEEVNRERQAG